MSNVEIILNGPVAVAAQELSQASTTDHWWQWSRSQCDMFAQEHSWAAAEPHLTDPRLRLRVAHARVLRGEDLAGLDLSGEVPADHAADEAGDWAVPLGLQPWEAAHWTTGQLTTYLGRSSRGRPGCFPPDQPELPTELAAEFFPGQVGIVEELDEWALSDWIEWVVTIGGTAEQAIAHQAEAAGYARSNTTVRAGEVDFAAAYPALLTVFGGDGAYCGRPSESLGRLRVWRLLRLLAGSADPADIAAFLARTRCLAWQEPDDEIWYLHLAIEDPQQGTTWVLDGHTYD